VSQATWETAYDRIAELQQPISHGARVHDFGGKDEKGNCQEQVAHIHAIQDLFGRGSHI
jgi:hypothetical protein